MATTWSSPVLLGLYDSPCPDPQLSPYENKIGGYPDFFSSRAAPTSPPSCQSCHRSQLLLVQVYCPLESSPYHRLLHVFCCSQPECWTKSQTWRVLRSQLRDPYYSTLTAEKQEQVKVASSSGFSASDWCDDADDWGSKPEDEAFDSELCLSPTPATTFGSQSKDEHESDVVEAQMKHLSLDESESSASKVKEGYCFTEQCRDYYPPCYISVIEEPTENRVEMKKVKKLLVKYQRENPDPVQWEQERSLDGPHCKKQSSKSKSSTAENGRSGGGEGYEKTVAKHGDRSFQKFHKQLSRCPNQIMRYVWKGSPLMITDSHAVQPPSLSSLKCKYCGAQCVFELQLMPPLVYILQQQTRSSQLTSKSPPVEYGTVLVYTCSKSCWSDSIGVEEASVDASFVREEYVFVQQDPDNVSMQKLCNQT